MQNPLNQLSSWAPLGACRVMQSSLLTSSPFLLYLERFYQLGRRPRMSAAWPDSGSKAGIPSCVSLLLAPSSRPPPPAQLTHPSLVCQIISMQAIHYLFLALITPPLLNAFSSSSLLAYSGGASTVGHILDWREMASRPTIPGSLTGSGVGAVGLDSAASGWGKLRGAWSGGKQISKEVNDPAGQGLDDSARIGGGDIEVWDFGIDDSRGWTMGVCWLIAAAFEYAELLHRYKCS